MLWRAHSLFRELNALDASTIRTASVSSEVRQALMKCMAASTPAAQSWVLPAESCRSSLITVRMAFDTILLVVSQIPIGLIPGHLSSAINLHAKKGERESGSTNEVQSLRASIAREWQSSWEAEWKEVHRRLQLWASRPDGPAEPLVLSAADLIVPASTLSNRTGWTGGGSPTPIRAEGWMGRPGGCFFLSVSRTVGEEGLFGSERSVLSRTPPLRVCVFDSRPRAASVFPKNIRLVKLRGVLSLLCTFWADLWRCFWRHLPSSTKALMFPSNHNFRRRSRQVALSLGLELNVGFWSRRMGIIVVATRATDSRADCSGTEEPAEFTNKLLSYVP